MFYLTRSTTFAKCTIRDILRSNLSAKLCQKRLPNDFGGQFERRLSTLHKSSVLNPTYSQTNLVIKRYKKKKSRLSRDSEEDEDDEDDEDEDLSSENPLLVDDILNPVSDGGELVSIDCGSLRVDSFCKAAFNLSRSKIEESFYKGDVYINGERPAKKSTEVSQGDEVDLVKHISPDDSNMVVVNRALLVHLPDKATETGRVKLQIKKWLNLTIEAHGKKKDD